MKIIDNSIAEFTKLFPRMKEEFPESEMKTCAQLSHAMESGKYHCFALTDENKTVGMALGYLNEEVGIFWLDYLQIFKENQNKSYGTHLLNALLYGTDETRPIVSKGILLEVENPESEKYEDNQVARMRFYSRFDIVKLDFNYLFPCNDGTTLPLNLCFIPHKDVNFVSKEEFVKAIKGAVETIHYDIPHAIKTMNTYIGEVKDVNFYHFELTDIDMNNEEEVKTLGELIYEVDPWVYPSLFDKSVENAKKVAPYLLRYETIYNHKYIKVGRINGKIAGFMDILETYVQPNHEEMKRAILDGLGHLTPEFDKVMEGYFDTLNYQWEGTQIVSLSVLKEYRRLHVGSKMLFALDSHKTYSLACVKNNTPARKLYDKCGFKYSLEYPGYTGVLCVELVKKGR